MSTRAPSGKHPPIVTSPTGWDKSVDSTFSDPLWRKAFRPVPFGTSAILAQNRPVSQEVCIRPIPLALFMVFQEPLHRRLEVKAVVWQHGIVVNEPLAQLLVEQLKVGKKQFFVPIDELLLDGAVEAFAVGIHAR